MHKICLKLAFKRVINFPVRSSFNLSAARRRQERRSDRFRERCHRLVGLIFNEILKNLGGWFYPPPSLPPTLTGGQIGPNFSDRFTITTAISEVNDDNDAFLL